MKFDVFRCSSLRWIDSKIAWFSKLRTQHYHVHFPCQKSVFFAIFWTKNMKIWWFSNKNMNHDRRYPTIHHNSSNTSWWFWKHYRSIIVMIVFERTQPLPRRFRFRGLETHRNQLYFMFDVVNRDGFMGGMSTVSSAIFTVAIPVARWYCTVIRSRRCSWTDLIQQLYSSPSKKKRPQSRTPGF